MKKWLLCDKLYTTTGTDVKRRPYAPAKINLLSTYSGGKTADNISNFGQWNFVGCDGETAKRCRVQGRREYCS